MAPDPIAQSTSPGFRRAIPPTHKPPFLRRARFREINFSGLSWGAAQTASCHPGGGAGGTNKQVPCPHGSERRRGESDTQATGLGRNTEPQRQFPHSGHSPRKVGTPSPLTLSPGGTDGPGTTRLSTGSSFAFFTSRTRGSLGASRALRTTQKRNRVRLHGVPGGHWPGRWGERPWLLFQGWGGRGRGAVKDRLRESRSGSMGE